MTFACDTVNFKTTTGAVNSTFNVSLALGGLAPKVLIAVMAGRTDALGTDGVGAGDVIFSRGYAVSTTSRRVVAFQSRTINPTAVAVDIRNDNILIERKADTRSGMLDVSDMSTANQVTFIVRGVFTQNYECTLFAMAGSDITNVAIFDKALDATTGTKTITDPGFTPDYVDFMSIGLPGGVNQADLGTGRLVIGAGIPATSKNLITAIVSRDNLATSDTASYHIDTECMAVMAATNSIAVRAAVNGVASGGYTWNIIETNGSAATYTALCVKGMQVDFGSVTTQIPADPGFDSIQPSFNPLGALIFSCCRAKSTTDTPSDHAELSLGAVVAPQSTGRAKCQGFLDPDAVTGAAPVTAVRNADCYVNTTAAGAVEGAMGLAPLSDNAALIKLSESVQDSAVNFVQFAVFGAAAAAPSTSLKDVIDPEWMVPYAR